MEHEPRRFLGNSDGAVDFIATDRILGVYFQPEASSPFVQSERTVFHDGARLHGELPLIVALVALEAPVLRVITGPSRSAVRADNSVWPADVYEELVGNLQIGEVDHGFHQCFWRVKFSVTVVRVHAGILRQTT